MRKILKFKSFIYVLLIALLILPINSCKKDKDELPELPPVESLLMDFSDFDNGVPQDKKAVMSYQNFGYSVYTVGLFNLAATANIILPAAAYAEAFNHEAVYLGDNSWKWTYSVTLQESTFTVELISQRITNEEYTLNMYVDKSGPDGFEDFKWVEGIVRYDRAVATWTIYESPAVEWPVAGITWTMDWEKELYTIKYDCLKPDSDLHGASIEHGVTEDPVFDAYYTITFPSHIIDIEWNRTTKAGHVKSPSFFADENWHCWDITLVDTVCE